MTNDKKPSPPKKVKKLTIADIPKLDFYDKDGNVYRLDPGKRGLYTLRLLKK